MGFVKITLENPEEVDEMRKGGKIGTAGIIRMEVNELHSDETVALLLDSYIKVAEDLIQGHPKDCQSCAVFEFHSKLLEAIKELEKKLIAKYSNFNDGAIKIKITKVKVKPREMWEK